MRPSVPAWIRAAWAPHARLLPLLASLTLLNAVLVTAIPFAMKAVFDSLQTDPTWAAIRHAVLVLTGLGLARFLNYSCLQNLRAYGNHLFERELRGRLFRRLLELGPTFHTGHSTGDTLTRLTNDIGPDMKLPWFLCSGIFRGLEAVTVFGLVAGACFRICVPLALVCLLPLPLLMLAYVRVSRLLEGRFAALQQSISAVASELDCSFQGIRLVKAFGAEDERHREFARALAERRQAELEALRAEVVLQSFHEYAWQALVALVLLVGGRMVIQGAMTLGDLMAFNGFAASLTFPIFELGSFLSKGRQSAAIIARLQEIDGFAPDVVDGPGGALPAPGAEPELEVQRVGFAYPTGRPVLRDVSLAVRAGERVAVVGRVGSGKSTLLALLTRRMDPAQGRVTRRGAALAGLPLREARAGMAYVSQDPVVFSDTLRANIVFGRTGIPEATLAWAVEASRLAQDLDAFPQGLDTPVGPRGTRLSGGQKQRLALARALAGEPALLLLDDCTASLDAATEEAVWRELAKSLPATAVVLVTHRISVLSRCDRVVVLGEDGTGLQVGTHAELADAPGEYRELYLSGEMA